jgi:hypothetical protein
LGRVLFFFFASVGEEERLGCSIGSLMLDRILREASKARINLKLVVTEIEDIAKNI